MINEKTVDLDFEKSSITLTDIEVIPVPTKTTFYSGENFDPSGVVITTSYANGTKKAVTDYTVTDGTGLTEDQTSVTFF